MVKTVSKRVERKGFSWSHWKAIPPLHRSCPVCGADDTKPFARNAPFAPGDIVRCRGCGMVFIDRLEYDGLDLHEGHLAHMEKMRTSSDLADLEASWEWDHFHLRLDEREALRKTYAAVLRRLHAYFPRRGRLLDFGSGWGFFMDEARSDGWDTSGVEVLPGHALYARVKLGLDVKPHALEDTTFTPATFDVVTSLQVFEHLEDPSAELSKIHTVLKRDGMLLLEVPNVGAPLVKVLRGRHRHFVPDHHWFFSPATLKRFVESHGFEVLETVYPERYTSLKGFMKKIATLYLPAPVTDAMLRAIERVGLGDAELPLTMREVVMVIARKLDDPVSS